MKNSSIKKLVVAFVTGIALVLSACGGGTTANAYDTYANAYKKVFEYGGFDANIEVEIAMNGETNTYNGEFKIDSTKNLMSYELNSDGNTTTQYSDGEYLYTERDGQKVKYSIKDGNSNSGHQNAPNKPNESDKGSVQNGQEPPSEAPTFDVSNYLDDFSSFLDAGKIKEMGLFDPIPSAAVANTTESNGVYTLELKDTVAQQLINAMANEQGGEDVVKVKDMKNLTYTATVKDGIVTSVNYSGTVTVSVDGSIMSTKEDTDYSLDFNIKINFINPGTAVTISMPDSDKYVLV